MTVTKEFVLAVADGIGALRSLADTIEKHAEAKADNGTGRLLRDGIERKRQNADLLAGWVQRHRSAVGLSEEDCRV